MALGQNIKLVRKRLGLTQVEVERRAGLEKGSIFAIESRDQQTTLHLFSIAKALGVSAQSLSDGSCLSAIDSESLTTISAESARKLPLLDRVPAGDWRVAMASHAVDAQDWISCPEQCSQHAYALRVFGVSMEPEYLAGDIVFVDPCAEAVHGSDVIVRQNNDEHTFKRLVIEGRTKMLKALNADWPGPRLLELAPDAEISGVVIGMYRGKRKA